MKPKIRKPFMGNFPVTFKFGEAPEWYTRITGYPHNGVDFGIPVGWPIYACDKGRVVWADNAADGRGLSVHLEHEWGISVYYHLSKLAVEYGHEVEKRDTLGCSGDTGWATGPHLHFGIKVKGFEVPGMFGWVNPLKYIDESIEEPAAPAIVPRVHRVWPGETLWSIAEKYYGKGYFWQKIYDANRDTIKDPSLIYPFQRLTIP